MNKIPNALKLRKKQNIVFFPKICNEFLLIIIIQSNNFKTFFQSGSAWFAFQRFKQGTDAAFAPTYEADPIGDTGYASYPDATDIVYQDPPFAQQQRCMNDFQAPAY